MDKPGKSKRGGARPGAGRPPGAKTKRKPYHTALFLNLQQASRFTGLSVAYLESQIAENHLFAVPGGENGAWMISRYALESFAGRRRFR